MASGLRKLDDPIVEKREIELNPEAIIRALPIISFILGLFMGFRFGRSISPSKIVRVFLTIDGKEVTQMNCRVDKKLLIKAVFMDKKGNVATDIDELAFSLTDASLGSLVDGVDKFTKEFMPAGQLGDLKCQLVAKDSGVELLAELDIHLVEADAVVVQLAGQEVDIPEVVPEPIPEPV